MIFSDTFNPDLANGRRLRKKQSQGAVRSENKERLVDLPRSCIALPRSHTPPLEFYKQTSISAIEASSTVSMTEPGLSDSSSLWTDDEENQASNLPRHHRGHHLVWNDTATIIIPTWSKSKYDRSPHPHTTYLHLSPLYTEMIRQELNEYKKNEMPVHNDSKIHTAWH
ncbi:hypothetical protein NQZ79_g6553 [Umbelopsis isabellina]|nr:hypothetical protein NQZ79_g6553 [Umbelopsis isabellina]